MTTPLDTKGNSVVLDELYAIVGMLKLIDAANGKAAILHDTELEKGQTGQFLKLTDLCYASDLAAHVAASDPHPGYVLESTTSTTPTANFLPIANGSGKLAAGWISEVLALADLADVTAKTGTGTTVVMSAAPSVTGVWSFNAGLANQGSLTFFDTNYGIGIDNSDLTLWANNAQGISFKQSNVSGPLSGRITASGFGVGDVSVPLDRLHVLGNVRSASTTTDLANKTGLFVAGHRSNSEEPLGLIGGTSTTTTGTVFIGGGISTVNAATQVQVYTAANNTTTTGTLRSYWADNGIFYHLGGYYGTSNLYLTNSSGTLNLLPNPGDNCLQSSDPAGTASQNFSITGPSYATLSQVSLCATTVGIGTSGSPWLKLIDTGSGNGRLQWDVIGSIDADTFMLRNKAGSVAALRTAYSGGVGMVGVGGTPASIFHVTAPGDPNAFRVDGTTGYVSILQGLGGSPLSIAGNVEVNAGGQLRLRSATAAGSTKYTYLYGLNYASTVDVRALAVIGANGYNDMLLGSSDITGWLYLQTSFGNNLILNSVGVGVGSNPQSLFHVIHPSAANAFRVSDTVGIRTAPDPNVSLTVVGSATKNAIVTNGSSGTWAYVNNSGSGNQSGFWDTGYHTTLYVRKSTGAEGFIVDQGNIQTYGGYHYVTSGVTVNTQKNWALFGMNYASDAWLNILNYGALSTGYDIVLGSTSMGTGSIYLQHAWSSTAFTINQTGVGIGTGASYRFHVATSGNSLAQTIENTYGHTAFGTSPNSNFQVSISNPSENDYVLALMNYNSSGAGASAYFYTDVSGGPVGWVRGDTIAGGSCFRIGAHNDTAALVYQTAKVGAPHIWATSLGSVMTLTGNVLNLAGLTASQFVKTDSSKNLVSALLAVADLPTMTSAELAGKISDETGSGPLVFATSPVLNNPTITYIYPASPSGSERVRIVTTTTRAELDLCNSAGTPEFAIWYGGTWNMGSTVAEPVRIVVDTTQRLYFGLDGSNRLFSTSSYTGFASSANASLWLQNTTNVTNNWNEIQFFAYQGTITSGIGSQTVDHTNAYADLAFYTRGTTGWGERYRITSVGEHRFGGVDLSGQWDFYAGSIAGQGIHLLASIANGNCLVLAEAGTSITGSANAYKSIVTTTGASYWTNQQNGAGHSIYYGLVLGAGDAQSTYGINGGQHWSVGLDNSDGDRFKISAYGDLGTNDAIVIGTDLRVGIGGAPDASYHLKVHGYSGAKFMVYGGDSTSSYFSSYSGSGVNLLTGVVSDRGCIGTWSPHALDVRIDSGVVATWDTTGNLQLGTTTTFGGAYNRLTVLGAVVSTLTAANATDKSGFFLGAHYTNAEEAVTGLYTYSSAGGNTVCVGGGSGSYNTATLISFYTAANGTTLTGTRAGYIDNSGTLYWEHPVYSSGTSAAYFFYQRDNLSRGWALYATGDNAFIWNSAANVFGVSYYGDVSQIRDLTMSRNLTASGRFSGASIIESGYVEGNPVNFRFDQDCLRYVTRWGTATVTTTGGITNNEVDSLMSSGQAGFLDLYGKSDPCSIEITGLSISNSNHTAFFPYVFLHANNNPLTVKMEVKKGAGAWEVLYDGATEGTITDYYIARVTSTGASLTGVRWTFSNILNPTYLRRIGCIAKNGEAYQDTLLKSGGTIYGPLSIGAGYTLQISNLTANTFVFADGSKNLQSVTYTGSGGVVRETSPSLTTPSLGVATATSINKVAITAPATSATLTIADGQTLTVNGSTTLTSGTHSGTNTGDQTITLTGDVTGSGTGSFAATIASAAVTLAKMANLAQDQFIGRVSASTGVPETATITAAARTVLDDTTVSAMIDTLGGASALGTGGIVRGTSPTITTPSLVDGSATVQLSLGTGYVNVANEIRFAGASYSRVSFDAGNGAPFLGYNCKLAGSSFKHDSTGTLAGIRFTANGDIFFYSNASAAANTTVTPNMSMNAAGAVAIGSLTASKLVATNGSKELVSYDLVATDIPALTSSNAIQSAKGHRFWMHVAAADLNSALTQLVLPIGGIDSITYPTPLPRACKLVRISITAMHADSTTPPATWTVDVYKNGSSASTMTFNLNASPFADTTTSGTTGSTITFAADDTVGIKLTGTSLDALVARLSLEFETTS